jgi:hypothetical protein
LNPDKLFDYLDGNLPLYEREQLEEQLASDPQLQRELAMARRIHSGMRGDSQETIAPPDPREMERGRKIGGRVGAAFLALVLLNVFIGIFFIVRGHQPKNVSDEARQQIASSLERAAVNALPPPSLADEIVISTSAAERNALADKVVAAAEQVGGSAAKALPNEHRTTVIVELAPTRETDFRNALVPLGAPPAPLATTPAPDAAAKKLLEVQINERETVPAHPQASP